MSKRLLLLPLVFAAACATQKPAEKIALPSPHHGKRALTSSTASLGMYPPQWGLPSRIVDVQRRIAVPLEQALDDLLQARVVYVAENHNNPHHHAVQAAILSHLWRRDRSIALGMEMFQRPYQTALDAYLASGDEQQLLEDSEYERRWGYDFALYRPLLELARAHRIPLVALNAPAELTKKVSKQGLAALTEEEREQVPDLDLSMTEHREMVEEAFTKHGLDPSKFEHFYAAQVIWDETMASEVARILRTEPAPARMVVLAGNGHVRHGHGIPLRAARRGAEPFRTIVPVMLGDDEPTLEELLDEAPASYLWVMALDESALPAIGVPEPRRKERLPASVTMR